MRVHIHCQVTRYRIGKSLSKKVSEAAARVSTQEELESPLASQPLEGSGRWTRDADASGQRVPLQLTGDPVHGRLSPLTMGVTQQQLNHPGVGRVVKDPPIPHLFPRKQLVIVIECCLNSVVLWMIGLNHDLAGTLTPPCPSG